jgi:hypothetical protein
MYQILSRIREATNRIHLEKGQSAATYDRIPPTKSMHMGGRRKSYDGVEERGGSTRRFWDREEKANHEQRTLLTMICGGSSELQAAAQLKDCFSSKGVSGDGAKTSESPPRTASSSSVRRELLGWCSIMGMARDGPPLPFSLPEGPTTDGDGGFRCRIGRRDNCNYAPLRTRDKSRDHVIVRAQKKVSKCRPNTPPISCSVVMDPQV